MRRFYAKVLVPLEDAGTVELEAEVTDLNALEAAARDALFGLLRRCIEFAEGRDDAEVEERDEVVPERPGLEEAAGVNGGPMPLQLAPEMVECPECHKEFTKQGIGVHRARAHPRQVPTAPEPKPEPIQPAKDVPAPRVCAEPGCDTLLSTYNKRKWCAVHEGRHAPSGFGRTA